MKRRVAGVQVLLVVACVLTAAAILGEENKFHLKPGAQGKVCLGCHANFEDTLKLPFVHTPVKAGACVDCHSPHASDHDKMLAAETKEICVTCHADIRPDGARSLHPPVAEGACIKCHDPHGAKNAKNLPVAGNDLCLGCHKDMAATLAANTFKHPPVEKSCLNCHDPHSSAGAPFLLKKSVPALCTACHKVDQPAFIKQHMGYAVGTADCVSCHDPHGSKNRGTLWASVHPPVAAKMCGQCHPDPGAPGALKPKKTGAELCRGCHVDLMNETFSKSRVHWPVVEKSACLNCHNPHAAKEKPLLKAAPKVLCGSCHADSVARQAKSLTKHPPIDEGMCTTCHNPHSSNKVFLLAQDNLIDLCGTCHDWQRHSTHPIGEKVIDPRNKNLTLDCESCHRAHGSPFKAFTHLPATGDLCVQCHENKKR